MKKFKISKKELSKIISEEFENFLDEVKAGNIIDDEGVHAGQREAEFEKIGSHLKEDDMELEIEDDLNTFEEDEEIDINQKEEISLNENKKSSLLESINKNNNLQNEVNRMKNLINFKSKY